jgi:Zn-dependent protease
MFSKTEVRDLIISIVVLAFVFSSFNIEELPLMFIVVIAVFISHELAHKFIAQRYGCFAEYKIWRDGLLLGVLTGFISYFLHGGIIFAAPGAVYIIPYVKKRFAFNVSRLTKKEYGLISLAGPLMNILIGIILLILSFVYPLDLLLTISYYSLLLALFNLLPIFPLDGSKIIAWNMKIWLIALSIPLLGLIFLNLI